MVNENELDHLFEGEMDNIGRQIISDRYVLICFIRLLFLEIFS